ncbi:MAG: RNA-guided endonuclease TnpB family protein, partial [Candidatus Heimdallarchaeaceae archaeon]
ILIRCDCYKLGGDVLKLPFGLKIRWKGKNRWKGKQGRLEIIYDDLSKSWYAFQTVSVLPIHQPIGNKRAYCDIGVRVLIMTEIDGEVIGYSGNSLLSDWWYWTKKIAGHQSVLKDTNDKYTSRQLRLLYRKRKRRFRYTVNTIVSRFVELCYSKGVSEIVMGNLTNIRNNNSKGKKANSMIHNFWCHRYLVQRIKEKAEEYGMRVIEVDESYTSSICPRCGSKNVVKRKRLFKCLNCGLEAHRDAVGCVNIGLAQNGGVVNGAVASPLLLSSETGTSHALA